MDNGTAHGSLGLWFLGKGPLQYTVDLLNGGHRWRMLTRFDTAKGFDADAGPFRQFSLTQASLCSVLNDAAGDAGAGIIYCANLPAGIRFRQWRQLRSLS